MSNHFGERGKVFFPNPKYNYSSIEVYIQSNITALFNLSVYDEVYHVWFKKKNPAYLLIRFHLMY